MSQTTPNQEGENNNNKNEFKPASAGLRTSTWGKRFEGYLESASISELEANWLFSCTVGFRNTVCFALIFFFSFK